MNQQPRTRMPVALAPAALAAALALALPGPAGAVRLDYEVGVSALRSDNIGLADTGGVEETVLMPWLRFGATQEGSRFRLDAHGSLQYLDYRDDTFDDGFRGSLSGQALWTVVDERIDFVVEDYLSRQPIDTLSAFNRGNEQQTNVFVAGPTFHARFGAAARGQLDLRYANSRAEETDSFDSDRYNAALRLLRDFGPTRSGGLNLEATRVDYDLGARNADYTRYDGYFSYANRLRRFDLTVDAGYTRLEPDDGSDERSSPLFRGRLGWRPSARSSFDVGASYEFADAAQDLVTLEEGAGTPQVAIGPDVYRQRRVDAGYAFDGARFDLRVRPYYQRVSYVDSLALPLDETRKGGLLEVGYRLRPRTRLSFTATRDDRDFSDLSREDRESTLGLGLENEFTRNWRGRIDVQRRERNSSVAGQDYEEDAVTVSFSYRR